VILNPFLETEILLGYGYSAVGMLPPNSMCFGMGGQPFIGRSVMRPDFGRCYIRFLDASGTVLGSAKTNSTSERRTYQMINFNAETESIKDPLADANFNRSLSGDESLVVVPGVVPIAQQPEIPHNSGSNVSNRSFIYAAFSNQQSESEHLLPADKLYIDTSGMRIIVSVPGTVASFEIAMDGFVTFDLEYYSNTTFPEPPHVGSGPYKEISTILFTGSAGVSGSDMEFAKTIWSAGDVIAVPELIFDLKNKDVGIVHA